MPLTKERIHYLLKVYISKKANAAEESELMDWILQAGEDSELKTYMFDIWNQYKPVEDLSYVNWDQLFSRIMQPPVAFIGPKIIKMQPL
jgi:transmembrane sensor